MPCVREEPEQGCSAKVDELGLKQDDPCSSREATPPTAPAKGDWATMVTMAVMDPTTGPQLVGKGKERDQVPGHVKSSSQVRSSKR